LCDLLRTSRAEVAALFCQILMLKRNTRPQSRPVLQNASEPEVLHWDHVEGDGATKTYVWLRDHDYIAIMKEYPDGSRRLVTAYWIEYKHEREKLLKKHKRRLGP